DYESQDQEPPFGTPSGKIELYSERLEENGFAPVPSYEETAEPPEGYFRLLYGRSPVHSFSRTQDNPWLSEIDPENKVWINAQVADKLGLRDGKAVILENQDGVRSNPIKVKKTERIRRDCVYMVHGFGHDTPQMKNQHAKGASDIKLQSDYALDPISGSAGMSVNFVKIAEEGGSS
ncbi:MAG: molybdopterin dinucleotide binding domain-containing protein, partial [Candidatus Bipolaricaulota bacterium]